VAARDKYIEKRATSPESAAWAWAAAYSTPAHTRAEADEALAALTPDMQAHLARSSGQVGHVRALAGDFAGAKDDLASVTRECTFTYYALPALPDVLLYGRALEATGDAAGACAAYEKILARWGKASASITAKEARARASSLRCAPQ
jgi:hypothetical protein